MATEYAVTTDTASMTVSTDGNFALDPTVCLRIHHYRFTQDSGITTSTTVRMTRRDAEALRNAIETICDALAEKEYETAVNK
jgi:hypothetical protein